MWTFTVPLRLALPLVLLTGLLLPAQSHACTCIVGSQMIFPAGGTVPPNVVFHSRKLEEQPFVLVGEQGARVPLREETIGDKLVRLHPGAPLEVGSKYSLQVDTKPGAKAYSIAKYTVQGEPDVKPPSPPGSADFKYKHLESSVWSSNCEPEQEGYNMQAAGASDDRASSEQLGALLVSASAPEQVLAVLLPGEDFIGSGSCFYNFDVRKGAGTEVALRSVDLAGNLSAPGPTVKLAKSTPTVITPFWKTEFGRAFIAIVGGGLIGLVLLIQLILMVMRRSTRGTRS